MNTLTERGGKKYYGIKGRNKRLKYVWIQYISKMYIETKNNKTNRNSIISHKWKTMKKT